MTNEKWKKIPGYEQFYEVSTMGRVRSLLWRGAVRNFVLNPPKILKPQAGKAGYLQVNLYHKNGSQTVAVSRLVLMAFKNNPRNKNHAAHLNGNILDNRLENLEWLSAKENDAHKDIHGTRPVGIRCGNARIPKEVIQQIRAARKDGYTLKTIASHFKISPSHAYNICSGKQRSLE